MLSTPKIKLVDSIVSFIVDLHKTTWFHATVREGNSCKNVSLESVSSFKYRMQSENEKKRTYLLINHHVVTIKRFTTFYRFICRFYLQNTCLYKSVKFYVSGIFHASKELHYFKHTDQLGFSRAWMLVQTMDKTSFN